MGFDLDQLYGMFLCFYLEYMVVVDVSIYESLDVIIDVMEFNLEMNIVVDLVV